MQNPQAIIFDLDDTLYPERDFVFGGYEAVVRAFANILSWGDSHVARMQALFDSPSRAKVFDTLLDESGIDPSRHVEIVAQMIDIYRNHTPRIALHVDADAALARWRGRVRLGLLSDGPLGMQQSKAGALGLGSRMDAMIFTDEWGRPFWKPHPRGFEVIAARLNVAADRCVYVGDNPAKDFVAPNQLGWTTIRIVRPGGTYENAVAPERGEPRHVIRALDELDSILTT